MVERSRSNAPGQTRPDLRALPRKTRRDTRARGLAVDYDGTLVPRGSRPTTAARRALAEARSRGFRVVLASGRIHAQLCEIARELGEVDGLVAENGAVVEAPVGSGPTLVGGRVARRVRARAASDPRLHVEWGEVIASVPIAERRPLARRLAGLPVYFEENVDRVMVLPHGVTKATGVRRALGRLGLGGRGFAAIGDAHNDLPMLRAAALSGAVANSERPVLRAADYDCRWPEARGVREFVVGPLSAWHSGSRAGPRPARPG